MAEISPPQSTATVRSFVRLLRRRLWVIVLCAVLVPAAVVAYSLRQEQQYRATASLLYRDSGLTALVDPGPVLSDNAQGDQTSATDVSLASLDDVAARTARRLDVPVSRVTRSVEFEPVGTSSLARVNATDTDPGTAARIANTYARQLISVRRRADLADVRRAQSALQTRLQSVQRRLDALRSTSHQGTQGQRGERLAERNARVKERAQTLERLGQLRSLAALVTGNVELAQRATVPTATIGPKTKRNAVVGVGLGLVLGLALALLFEMLDRRLRDPAEIAELVDLPILGVIPRSRALAEPPSISGLPDAESQAFHMLRTTLRYYNEDRELGSVLITSAGPREGKTTVAWNLASVSAQAGQKVLLLEADLRRPSLAARFHAPADRGLTDVLARDARLADVVHEVVVGTRASSSRATCTIDLVVAGRLPGSIAGLIESERMDHLILEAQEHYDLVVIDTPPISVVPDAIPLVGKVSGVVLVMRLGTTTRDAIRVLGTRLRHIRAPVLGAVVNGISGRDSYYQAAYDTEAYDREEAVIH
jgi:non-specific protein-tyrosine kinase